MNASFINCIFWGGGDTVTNEVVAFQQGVSTFNINFSNCLWKVSNAPANVSTSNVLNVDPMFDSVNNQSMYYDFHLKPALRQLAQAYTQGYLMTLMVTQDQLATLPTLAVTRNNHSSCNTLNAEYRNRSCHLRLWTPGSGLSKFPIHHFNKVQNFLARIFVE